MTAKDRISKEYALTMARKVAQQRLLHYPESDADGLAAYVASYCDVTVDQAYTVLQGLVPIRPAGRAPGGQHERSGKMWTNTCERYGEQVAVESIADYRELNPDGEFQIATRDGIDVIVENVDGQWEIIAEAAC